MAKDWSLTVWFALMNSSYIASKNTLKSILTEGLNSSNVFVYVCVSGVGLTR